MRVRIWNASTQAPVFGMPVHLAFLDFGVGTVPIPIASTTVDVGVKGSATQPAFASIPWTTPGTPGHYCLQAQLDPADDVDPGNNLGQENTDVRAAQSPATFTFELRNSSREVHTYHYEVDAYVVPDAVPCAQAAPVGEPSLARHRRSSHPMPEGFAITLSPERPRLLPGEQVTIAVTSEPPPDFVGALPLNVNVFHERGFVGGVTLTTVKEA